MTSRVLKYLDTKDESILRKLGTEELRYLDRISKKGSRKGGAEKAPAEPKAEEPKPKKKPGRK